MSSVVLARLRTTTSCKKVTTDVVACEVDEPEECPRGGVDSVLSPCDSLGCGDVASGSVSAPELGPCEPVWSCLCKVALVDI